MKHIESVLILGGIGLGILSLPFLMAALYLYFVWCLRLVGFP